MIEKRPLHPLLFSIYPVLYLFSRNISELHVAELWFPLIVAVGLGMAGWIALRFILRNTEKSALLLSLFILFCFGYGAVKEAFQETVFGGLEIGRSRYLLLVWLLSIATGAWMVAKLRRGIKVITVTLNVCSIVLILFPLSTITIYELKYRDHGGDNKTEHRLELPLIDQTRNRPDIYYFIFDRYANSGSLQESYGYDNTKFLNELRARGFYIAERSHANYSVTFLSLSSIFSLDYLKLPPGRKGIFPDDRTAFYEFFQQNKVMDGLKTGGYKIIHLGSWFKLTRKLRVADRNINYFKINLPGLLELWFRSSPFNPVVRKLIDSENEDRLRIKYEAELFDSIPGMAGPKFVFGHFLLPHPSYLFDSSGALPTPSQIRQRGDRNNYIQQLEYTNKLIIGLIDKIVEKSQTPPVIVVQSDEGPYLYADEKTRPYDIKAIEKRTGIINALYLPEGDTVGLYPGITSVNTLRWLCNKCFGMNLPMLEDRVYYVPNVKQPFTVVDVTDLLKAKEIEGNEKVIKTPDK
jgi:hypothetical protein